MVRQPIKTSTTVVLGIASLVVIVAGYTFIERRQKAMNPKDTVIPSLTQFAEGFKMLVQKDESDILVFDDEKIEQSAWPDFFQSKMYNDTVATGIRLCAGLILGILAAFGIGIFMGSYTPAGAFFKFAFIFWAMIPATAMLAIYFVLFGTDMLMFVAIVALSIFPGLAMSTYTSVMKDVKDTAIYKSYTLGASAGEIVWDVIRPQITPRFLQFVERYIAPAMIILIAAEWMVADIGYGYTLRMESRNLNMNIVYIDLIILGLVGLAFTFGIGKLRQTICRWYET